MTEPAETTVEDVDKVSFKTPKDKEVELQANAYGHWFVTMKAGGKLPKVLEGTWTSYDRAEKAVELWLAAKPPARTGDETYKPKGARSKKVDASS